MRGLLLALRFLTIIPIGKMVLPTNTEIGKSSSLFPVVGLLQGILAVAVAYLFSRFISWEAASLFAVGSVILTNGGFHVDGFADTVDGLAGGATAEDSLKIMRDSQVGAIGVAAVIFLLLAEFVLIKGAGADIRYGIILTFPIVGRWSLVPMAYFGSYARKGAGLGRIFIESATLRQTLISTALSLILVFPAIGTAGVIAMFAVFILTCILTAYFNKRIGGITGDVLGFNSEVSEVLYLLITLAAIEWLTLPFSGLRSFL